MSERVAILSGSPEWGEGLRIAFNLLGAEAVDTGSGKAWTTTIRAFRASAVVVHTENPGAGVSAEERRAESERVMDAVVAEFPELPLVLVAAAIRPELTCFVAAHNGAEVQIDSDGGKLAAAVLAAVERLRPRPPPPPAPWGIIELTLGQAQIECIVRAGLVVKKIGPFDWDRREAELVNEEFQEYEADDDIFREKVDRSLLERTGKRLLWHVFERPLAAARTAIEQHIVKGGKLYHRVTLADGDLEFVPLELVATANPGQYLREVVPLSRRLIVKEQHGDPDRPWVRSAKEELRVLFILSDVEGSLSLANRTFKGKDPVSLEKLQHIHAELQQTIDLYGADNVKPLRLEVGKDATTAINKALDTGVYDVVHFAGHSLRADWTNEVFLVLPGIQPRSLVAYNADDFARRAAGAGVRLVLLSSCEGASCRAMSRLASFGVPAVVGFRWKVDDRDAAKFTPALHEALRRSRGEAPVAQAFHQALLTLKESTKERITWFSPVLMLQPSQWSEFWGEREV